MNVKVLKWKGFIYVGGGLVILANTLELLISFIVELGRKSICKQLSFRRGYFV